jgi:hypothetical protein
MLKEIFTSEKAYFIRPELCGYPLGPRPLERDACDTCHDVNSQRWDAHRRHSVRTCKLSRLRSEPFEPKLANRSTKALRVGLRGFNPKLKIAGRAGSTVGR